MKKTLPITIALLLSVMTSVQGNNTAIMLGFAASFGGETIALDSILIQNLTKGCDTMLYAPDNYIVLDITTGVNDNKLHPIRDFELVQNAPNPFTNQTAISNFLPEKGYAELKVRNITGQVVAAYKGMLEAGTHLFTFYPGSERFYILTAVFNGETKSIKMAASGLGQKGKYRLAYDGMDHSLPVYKTATGDGGFLFSFGDLLRFTGYATTPTFIVGNNEIEDAPMNNQVYTFNIVEGIRCPGNPSLTDIEGNTYNTVQVGEQCWLRENLKTTHYKNGTPINYPGNNNAAWQTDTVGAYAWYNNEILWKEIYGALYNWFAAVNPNGLCPEGWHLPTNDEWYVLTDFIGGTQSPNGNKLKSCRQVNSPVGGGCTTDEHPRWNEHSIHYGTNNYGFSGLAGNGRNPNGAFPDDDQGFFGTWWSSTQAYMPGNVWARILLHNHGHVSDGFYGKHSGFSVRCLRDY
jgi:uncharacterized protein (TIGR02145 family)